MALEQREQTRQVRHEPAGMNGRRASKRSGSAFSPGEALQGLRSKVILQRVSAVRTPLAQRQVTIATCRDNSHVNPSQVPGDWDVTDVLPWAPGQILVQVNPQPSYQGG